MISGRGSSNEALPVKVKLMLYYNCERHSACCKLLTRESNSVLNVGVLYGFQNIKKKPG